MGEDEPVSRREFDSYKHYNEMQRDSDNKALQSQVAGVASVLSTHFEDDRRQFARTQNILWGLLATHLVTLGGIITVLLRH